MFCCFFSPLSLCSPTPSFLLAFPFFFRFFNTGAPSFTFLFYHCFPTAFTRFLHLLFVVMLPCNQHFCVPCGDRMYATDRERLNCDLHRWGDTCSVTVCSDTHSHSLMQARKRKHTHSYFREAKPGTTWRTISRGRVMDAMGRNGREIKQHYEAMKMDQKGGERSIPGSGGGRTGSSSLIWREELAVISPAEWPYRCSVVWLHAVSLVLWEAVGRCWDRAGRKWGP